MIETNTVMFNDTEISVVSHVPIETEEAIINTIVGCVVNSEYKPSRFSYAINSCVLDAYTNVDITNMDINALYELFDTTDVMDNIIRNINGNQLDRIASSARQIIEAKLNEHPFKKLGKDIHNVLVAFNGVIEGTDSTEIKQIFEQFKSSDIVKNLLKNNSENKFE